MRPLFLDLCAAAAVAAAACVATTPTPSAAGLQPACEEFWAAWRSRSRERYAGEFAALRDEPPQRQSFRAPRTLVGVEELTGAALDDEWKEFEVNARGEVAETLRVEGFEVLVVHEDVAVVRYSAQTRGGVRWKYTDQGFVLHALVHAGPPPSRWKTWYVFDTWSLSYNVRKPWKRGKSTLTFDWAQVVTPSLAQARTFYDAVMGPPEVTSSWFATYSLRGGRFFIIAPSLPTETFLPPSLVPVRPNLPNGVAIIDTPNLARAKRRLGSRHILVDAERFNSSFMAGDAFVAARDPSGNVFVLRQKNFDNVKGCEGGAVAGFPSSTTSFIEVAKAVALAWVSQNASALASWHNVQDGAWLDSTRVLVRGPVSPWNQKTSFMANLEDDWQAYDGTASCRESHPSSSPSPRRREIYATWRMASPVHSLSLSPTAVIVHYTRVLESREHANHPFQEVAHVTHLLTRPSPSSSSWLVLQTAIGPAAARTNSGLVKSFDYSAYPETDMDTAEAFYRSKLGFRSSYTDTDWVGFWSTDSVFGIYKSVPKRDGIPVRGKANGYLSLEVRNASQVYVVARDLGGLFPVIPSINTKQGVDVQPGYTQVVVTDGGNGKGGGGSVMVFTSYP